MLWNLRHDALKSLQSGNSCIRSREIGDRHTQALHIVARLFVWEQGGEVEVGHDAVSLFAFSRTLIPNSSFGHCFIDVWLLMIKMRELYTAYRAVKRRSGCVIAKTSFCPLQGRLSYPVVIHMVKPPSRVYHGDGLKDLPP